jgi:hypothetical protein
VPQDRTALPPLEDYVQPPSENGGRPRVQFSEAQYTQIKELCSIGLTEEQVIESMGYSRHILQDRKKTDPQFREALVSGRALGIATVANAQFASAVAGSVQAQQNYLRAKDPLTWHPEISAQIAIERQKQAEMADIEGNRIELEVTVVKGLPRPEDESFETQDQRY